MSAPDLAPIPRQAELLELAASKGVLARLNPVARRRGEKFIQIYSKSGNPIMLGEFLHATDAIRFLKGGR